MLHFFAPLRSLLLVTATILALLPGIASAAVTVIEPQTTFELTVRNDPNNTGEGDRVTLRLWIPPNITKLRGMILCGPGAGGGDKALFYAQNPYWQILAQRHGFGLAGIRWDDAPGQNPGRAATPVEDLEYALKTIGIQPEVGHPELEVVPIAIWGMSASGGFAVGYADERPHRCIAFCDNKGGSIGSYDLTGDALSVPGLLCYNENDLVVLDPPISHKGAPDAIAQAHVRFRAKGALVTIVPDWGIGHEYWGYGQYLALAYFDQIIESRLPDNYQLGTAPTLVTLSESDGWLGTCNNFGYTVQPDFFTDSSTWGTVVGSYSRNANTTLPTVIKRTDFSGSAASALDGVTYTWLPNEYIARLWQVASIYTRAARISSPDEFNNNTGNLAYVREANESITIIAASKSGTITSITWFDGLTPFASNPTVSSLNTNREMTFGLHPIYAKVSTTSVSPSMSGFSLLFGRRGTATAPKFTAVATAMPGIISNDTPSSNRVDLTATASATDGGLDRLITYTWSKVSGPGNVTWGPGNGLYQGRSLTATFDIIGKYTLRVTATNAEGKFATSDVVILPDGPTCDIIQPSAATVDLPYTVTFQFSENVIGFTADKIAVTNGVLSDFSGSNKTYLATITPKVTGTMVVSVQDEAATNTDGSKKSIGVDSSVKVYPANWTWTVGTTPASSGDSGGGGGCGLGSGVALAGMFLTALAWLRFRRRQPPEH